MHVTQSTQSSIALRGLRYVDCVVYFIYGAMQVALRKQSAFMQPPHCGGRGQTFYGFFNAAKTINPLTTV